MGQQEVNWDEVFEEVVENNRKTWDALNTPEALARTAERRRLEIQREIAQGLRDADGEWIFTESESDEDDDEDEDEE